MKHLMISGTGRSGTNIIKKIFSQHSQVASLPFEHRFVIDPDGIIDFYNSYSTTWSPYYADLKIKRLESYLLNLASEHWLKKLLNSLVNYIDPSGLKITSAYYSGWELSKWIPNYEKYVSNLLRNLKKFEFNGRWPGSESYSINNKMYFAQAYYKESLKRILGEFLSNCIKDILINQNKQIFVEDNTWNILFAKELNELSPYAKLIHVVREPRDVVASMMVQKWAPDKLDHTIQFYKSLMDKWLLIKKQLHKDFFIEIRFEDMVFNQSNELKRLCDFIDIDFEEKMLNYDLNQKSNIGRWYDQFTETDKKNIEQHLREYIYEYNYQ